MTVVTFRHLRTVPRARGGQGYCRDQSKAWAKRHGLDFKAFVRNGIAAEQLEAIGDAFALELVRWARECEAKDQVGARHG